MELLLEDSKEILHKHRIEKLPIVDDSGTVKGLITSKDITNNADFPNASKDGKGRPSCWCCSWSKR